MLNAQRARELLSYDSDAGVLAWRITRGGHVCSGKPAGSLTGRYIRIGIDGRGYRAHRVAWLIAHGAWPTGQIDHINGNRADNRLANLRDVSPCVNAQNQRAAHKRNESGLLGATFHAQSGRWRAQILHEGKNLTLGRFDTAEAAHGAYLAAKRNLHEGNTL